jgi:uncharacterized iron-regulated membrane protein
MARTIWPKLGSALVARAVKGHMVMGLAISALLYIICLSGTVAVFEDELEWWEQPDAPAVATVAPAAAQAASEAALAVEPDTTHLYLYLPREGWPRFAVGTDDNWYFADRDGQLTTPRAVPWNEFLIDLHYYLHLPETFGMIIVAIFGVMMIAMSISGLLAHPRVFKDAFTFRPQARVRLSQTDLHNRLSVWTAPFHIAIALTGAMIGLFAVMAVVLAQTSFDGDRMALSEAVFGDHPEADTTPAAAPNVAAPLARMPQIAPDQPAFLVVGHDPNTAGQHVEIYADAQDRLIYGETYTFAGDGTFTGTGNVANGPAGLQIAMSTYRLHFGDFGGLFVKVLYGVLGLFLCVIIASGLNIYFAKRAEKGRAAPRLAAAWAAIVWGSPALLALTLCLTVIGAPAAVLSAVFWCGLTLIAAAAAALPHQLDVARALRLAGAALLVLAPSLHFGMYGISVSVPGATSLVLLGIAAALNPWRSGRIVHIPARQTASSTPA